MLSRLMQKNGSWYSIVFIKRTFWALYRIGHHANVRIKQLKIQDCFHNEDIFGIAKIRSLCQHAH